MMHRGEQGRPRLWLQGWLRSLVVNRDASIEQIDRLARERWVWTTVVTAAFLLGAGPALRSPDGLEMLRLAAQWLGGDATVADPGFWPKLWPALNVPAVALGFPVQGARLLNVLLWGLTAYPLHLMASHLGGASAARRAMLLYLLLPLFWSVCTVLDARPLSALLTTGFVACALQAVRAGRSWRPLFVLAALAPLARPEGILLPVMAGFVVGVAGLGMRRAVMSGVLCLVPHLIAKGASRGVGGHEALFAPLFGTWTVPDVLSLFGASSVPTAFRAFALAAVESEVVAAHPANESVWNLVMSMPLGLLASVVVLVSGVGFVGMVLALRGLAHVLPRRRKWLVLGAVALPWMGVAIAPMARGQAAPVMNYMFLFPGVIALAAVGMVPVWRGRMRWPVLVAVCWAVEAIWSPLRPQAPYFIETSEAADLARAMLKEQPPQGPEIATDLSGRDLVLSAGFEVVQLEPVWLRDVPDRINAVLISSVGAWGEDGGRALSLLEDARWQVAWVTADGDIAASQGQSDPLLRSDKGWYALLVERAAPLPADAGGLP